MRRDALGGQRVLGGISVRHSARLHRAWARFVGVIAVILGPLGLLACGRSDPDLMDCNGIGDATTTWTAEAQSPDGQCQFPQSPHEVLGWNTRFMQVSMKWLSPRRLEVGYTPAVAVPPFQVVRLAGVDILLRPDSALSKR